MIDYSLHQLASHGIWLLCQELLALCLSTVVTCQGSVDYHHYGSCFVPSRKWKVAERVLPVMQVGGTVPAFKWSEEGGLVHPATPPRGRILGALPSHLLQRQGSSAGVPPY